MRNQCSISYQSLDNVQLLDYLSRSSSPAEIHHLQAPVCASSSNHDNWKFCETEFEDVVARTRPVDLDCCCDSDGLNALTPAHITEQRDFLQQDVAGHACWINPPFRLAGKFIKHYLRCKAKAPATTSALFVLPNWNRQSWWPLIKQFRVVKYYPAGTTGLFSRVCSTNPAVPCQQAGPTKWPVVVLYDAPTVWGRQMPLPVGTERAASAKSLPTAAASAAVSGGIYYMPSTGFQPKDQQLIVLSATVDGCSIKVLFDSGCSHSAVNTSFITRRHIHTEPSSIRGGVKLADGTVRPAKFVQNLRLRMGGWHGKQDMFVTDIADYDIILGMDWITKWKPVLDWERGSVSVQFRGKAVELPKYEDGAQQARLYVLSAEKTAKQWQKGAQCFAAILQVVNPDPADELHPDDTDFGGAPQFGGGSSSTQNSVKALLQEFQDVCRPPTGVPPSRFGKDFTIKLQPGSDPAWGVVYRMSPAELREVRKQLDVLLQNGWIRPSESPFGAPILFVRKKDNSLRMCVDYRRLNAITVKNRAPLPRVEELFDQLSGSKVWSKLDLAQGYHQMRVAEESVHRTAFRTRYGHFEFTVLPFGLTNAPSAFMTMMHEVLKPFLDKFVVVFLDDILIYSRTEGEHLVHLRMVLGVLREQKLQIKLSKCAFCMPEVEFLGHVVSAEGVKVDAKKTEAVQRWPVPRDVHEVRMFLGLAGYYRKFVHGFARIAAPLTELTKQAPGSFADRWGAAEQSAFEQLKSALSSPPVLLFPDFSKPFVLYTDSSEFAQGATLLQDQGKGEQPVCFTSHKLSAAERNYGAGELELLAVVRALKEFRTYLEGSEFTVLSDHQNLRYVHTQIPPSKRYARWVEYLQQYAAKIVYVKGSKNLADALSRRPDHFELNAITAVGQDLVALIRDAYKHDPQYNADNTKFLRQLSFQPDLQLYFYQDRVAVPAVASLRQKILHDCHDDVSSAHLGFDKTMYNVSRRFWWPRMRKLVEQYVQSCPVCQRVKADKRKPAGLLQPLPVPEVAWESIAMDFVTELPECGGCDAVWTVTDRLTKQVHMIPVRKKVGSMELADLFAREVYRLHGMPSSIVSDRDGRFLNPWWKEFMSGLGTKLKLSTAFHPATDGQSERSNQTMEQLLRGFVDARQQNWVKLLPYLEFAYNNSVHAVHGSTPFYLVYGLHPRAPIDEALQLPAAQSPLTSLHSEHTAAVSLARQQLSVAHNQQAAQANKHRRDVHFDVGQQVLLSAKNISWPADVSNKLVPKFLGPFKVAAVMGSVNYKLDLPSTLPIHPVFHVSLLKAWVPSDVQLFPDTRDPLSMPPPVVPDDNQFTVESLVSGPWYRGGGSVAWYKVRWQGYGRAHDEWVRKHDIHPDVVRAYEQSKA
jgi:hypothetical protein